MKSAGFTGSCGLRIMRLLGVVMRLVQKALTFDDVLLVPPTPASSPEKSASRPG